MFPDPRPDWQRRWDPFFLAHKFLPENHQPSSKVVMFPEPRPDWQRRWEPFFLAHKFLPKNHQQSSKVVMFPEPRPDWQQRWDPFFLTHKFLPEKPQPSSKEVMFPEPRTDPFFLTNEFIPQSPSYEERPTETENRNSEGTEKENRNKIDMDSVVPYPNLNCNFNVKYGTKYVNAVSALPNVRDTAKTIDNTPPRPPQGVIVDRVTPKQGHKIQDTTLYTIHLQYKIPETSYDILECVKIKESHQNIKVIDYQDKEFNTNANKYHDIDITNTKTNIDDHNCKRPELDTASSQSLGDINFETPPEETEEIAKFEVSEQSDKLDSVDNISADENISVEKENAVNLETNPSEGTNNLGSDFAQVSDNIAAEAQVENSENDIPAAKDQANIDISSVESEVLTLPISSSEKAEVAELVPNSHQDENVSDTFESSPINDEPAIIYNVKAYVDPMDDLLSGFEKIKIATESSKLFDYNINTGEIEEDAKETLKK